MKNLATEAVSLLQELIRTESFSREEDRTADLILGFLKKNNVKADRLHNNVWACNKLFDPLKPTFLLNSHHDTVKPNKGYSRNPFEPTIEDGKLFGLGSNDAGGALVALLSAFLTLHDHQNLRYNLIFAATAEEEISGKNGIELLLPHLDPIHAGIVGEPTGMDMAVAEKGLLVLDCRVKGQAGHAAREEGNNAIYKALTSIDWFKNFRFPKISATLGEIKMSVTQVSAGSQHNVVPAECNFTVDVRTTDAYSNEELLSFIRSHLSCEVEARSLRLNPSSIPLHHPLVLAGKSLGRRLYGSPTLSDQALMNFPTVKIGPGDSARSHSADEFIFIHEIEEGIDLYLQLLHTLNSIL